MEVAAKPDEKTRAITWRVRVALVVLLVLAIGVVFVTNKLLTDRFTESTRNRAECGSRRSVAFCLTARRAGRQSNRCNTGCKIDDRSHVEILSNFVV